VELCHELGPSLLSLYALKHPINSPYVFVTYLPFYEYHSGVCNHCLRQDLVVHVSDRKALCHVIFGK
jgi:hypothetical protein